MAPRRTKKATTGELPTQAAAHILDTPITQEMTDSFLEYSLSVIVSRALPDARDGLKPVQRRILYAMWETGLHKDRPHRKSMSAVGEVLKKYHPHGDSAVYDAMVRLAQDWSLRLPLVDGHGNFGSLDDGPAAARYTEARLSPAGTMLLADVGEDTVDMTSNFDGSTQEPSVLPAAFPNLLVNGAAGIAVGMRTSIPQHNLIEVVDALCHLLDNPKATAAELSKFVKGPDFPCGAIAYPAAAIAESHATGKGRFHVRSRATVESLGGRRVGIVFTELPPTVGPERVIAKIKERVQEKRLAGVSDVRDLSDRHHGMRLVVEVKTGFDPDVVLAELYRLTPLEESFTTDSVVLVGGKPVTCSLLELCRIYLDHRFDVIRRRARYRLERAESRAHILEGLLAALDQIDAVVAAIRSSKDTDTAKTKLRKLLGIDEAQAVHILDMPLRRLTGLEAGKLRAELAEKRKLISELKALLASPKRQRTLIAAELRDVADRFGTPRRTTILTDTPVAPAAAVAPKGRTVADAAPVGAIADEPCQVIVGHDGTIARLTGEHTRSKTPTPVLAHITTATRATLAAIDTEGRWWPIEVVGLPPVDATKIPKRWGGPVTDHIDGDHGDIVAVVPAGSTHTLAMMTANGVVKRLKPDDLPRRAGDTIITLTEGDQVVSVAVCEDDDHLVAVSSAGQLLRFAATSVRPQGRSAGGMAGMRVGEDSVVAFTSMPADGHELAVAVLTDAGSAKTWPVADYPSKGRGTGGVRCITFKKTDTTVTAATVAARPVGLGPRGSVIELPAGTRRDSSGAPTSELTGVVGAL